MAYKVLKNFTDSTGKAWSAGSAYTETNQARIDTALAAGNVGEDTGAASGQGDPNANNPTSFQGDPKSGHRMSDGSDETETA